MRLRIESYVGRGRPRTQVSLAKAIGVSEGYLSELISGDKPPTQDTAIAIANALGLTVMDIIDDERVAREWELVRCYRLSDSEHQRTLETTGATFARQTQTSARASR